MTSRNRIRKPLTLLLLTVLFNQPALSEQTLTVKSLRFSGNRKISDRKLLRQILTGHPAWYAWLPFVRHPRFDSGDFSNDILRLESYYKDRGYYNVSIDAQTTRREDRVELVIQIDEGIQTRLKKLSSNGLHGVDSSHVIRNLTLQPPQPFRGSLLEPDKRSILNYLKNSGYPYASVSASIRLNPEDGSAFVIYHVDPGQKATFGEVVVTGNNGVSTDAIRRGLDFRPEGPFLKDRLINTQRRIYRAGAFRAVTVKPDLSDSSRTSVDVNVSVQERPFNHIRIGLGYDTEESVRGSGAWGHRNFLGGARNLTITGRASRILVEGETNFRQPFVIDSRTDLGLTAYIRRLREPGVRGTHVGGGARFVQRVRQTLGGRASIRTETDQSGSGHDALQCPLFPGSRYAQRHFRSKVWLVLHSDRGASFRAAIKKFPEDHDRGKVVSAAQWTIDLCDAALWRGHQAAIGGKDRQLGEVLRGGIRQPSGMGAPGVGPVCGPGTIYTQGRTL